MKKLIVLVLVAMLAVGVARAMEPKRPDRVSMNPYFSSEGKWFAR